MKNTSSPTHYKTTSTANKTFYNTILEIYRLENLYIQDCVPNIGSGTILDLFPGNLGRTRRIVASGSLTPMASQKRVLISQSDHTLWRRDVIVRYCSETSWGR